MVPHHGRLHHMIKFQQPEKKKEDHKEKSSLQTKLPTGSLWRQQCLPKNTGSSTQPIPHFPCNHEHSLGGKRTTKVSGFLVCFLSQTASLDVCIKAGTGTAHFLQAKRRCSRFFFPALGGMALELSILGSYF